MFYISFLAGEQVDRALHLALAALLGNDIYNFGELVGQQCLSLHVRFSLNHFWDFFLIFSSTLLLEGDAYVSRGLCFTVTHVVLCMSCK